MPIESKGRRDPALAAAIKAGKPPVATEWEYVVGRRPLKVGEETRQPGDPIPEAASWPRLESWLNSGAVVAQMPGTARAAQPAKTAVPRRETRVRQVHDDGEPPARPVLRPRKGATT